jgi:hypothetical protein
VAFEDGYIRAHWDSINALCKLNGILEHRVAELKGSPRAAFAMIGAKIWVSV